MKVKDIMIRQVRSILPDANAEEAMNLLEMGKISGLPVIDESGLLQGMFTEKNVLSYILPSYLEKVGTFIYDEDSKATKKKFAELSSLKVKDLMRKEVVTITEETTLSEAAKVMLVQKARRIPVVDKTGKVLGIIARCDVLKALRENAAKA